ncbi:MAG: PQQ-dependent sugar dehydrogenase [Deltaproteobacteria bacterium]|nr:PQQ-dependent sugar dehydrogenase [Deltaproteobacteria bacterium]
MAAIGLLFLLIASLPAFSAGNARFSALRNPTVLEDPIPDRIQQGGIEVKLAPVATGLTAPNWGVYAPSHPDLLFVSDQNGTLWKIELTTGDKTPFLDMSSRLVELGVFGPDSFDERGFLGFAFHPDYAANGRLYTYTSEPAIGAPGEANHQSVLTEWLVPSPGDPSSVADVGSARELLRVDEPQFNHNAGGVNFGPDGKLYVSFGDGGGADDRDGQTFLGEPIVGHGAKGNGQDPSNLLGTIIRIDPSGNNSSNGAYGIPGDNPFLGMNGFREEIHAYGFRNPFRFSFDAESGELYAADVGQNSVEEVDVVSAGGNYGWNVKEGSFFFEHNDNNPGSVTDAPPPDAPQGLIDPIAEYDHDEGVAVIGGFVYRGTGVPSLYGKYVFGELAKPGSESGRLFYLEGSTIFEFPLLGRSELGLRLLGFGQDADGELYVLGNTTGTPFGSTGEILKIVSNPSYDLSGGLLHIDALDVSDATGAAVFRADMAVEPGSDPIIFGVVAASVLSERFKGSGASFDFETGELMLPIVDVFDSQGNLGTYSAGLKLLADPDRIRFEVTEAAMVP